MKRKMIVVVFLVVIGLVGLARCSSAVEPLLIVTEPYPPFIFEENSPLKGIDYEVTEAVFQQMNIPVKFAFFPWNRCILMMQKGEADALLDATFTEERKAFLIFPTESISQFEQTLFFKKGKQFPVKTLDDLKQYKIGAQRGYTYTDDILEVLVHRIDVASLTAGFHNLAEERLDFFIADKIAGLFEIKQMGIADQIASDPLSLGPAEIDYLAFAKKPGYEELAEKFSQALNTFKTSAEYQTILVKYGQIAGK